MRDPSRLELGQGRVNVVGPGEMRWLHWELVF